MSGFSIPFDPGREDIARYLYRAFHRILSSELSADPKRDDFDHRFDAFVDNNSLGPEFIEDLQALRLKLARSGMVFILFLIAP